MARIAKYEQLANGNDKVHGPVLAGWKIFDAGGARLVQLDTYGSPDRQFRGKVSQSVQLDEASAVELVKILKRAFPGMTV
jgi:hypothetical protein